MFQTNVGRLVVLTTAVSAGETSVGAPGIGTLAEEFLTYIDPHRTLVKSLGLSVLPSLVVLRQDCSLLGVAEGWDPATWRPLAEELAQFTSWSKPTIPVKGDPVAYPGTPALAS